MKLALASLFLLTSTVHAFAPLGKAFSPRAASAGLKMTEAEDAGFDPALDSQPSDSSSEDLRTVDVEAEDYTPTVSESVVNNVLNEFPAGGATVGVSEEARASINELLLKLEAMNPTENPATSPLINGVWTLKYAGGYTPGFLPSPTRQIALALYDGGYSPGIFALSLAQTLPEQLVDVGDLKLYISRDNPRVEAKITATIFGNESEVSVKTRLAEKSGVRLSETYESASVLGRAIDIPEQLQYSRELYVTYLDDEIMVVRSASGVPEVLVRD